MYGYCPATFLLVDIPITVWQLLNVAVEIKTDHLSIAIDDRTAGIAAYRVTGVDEVHRRRQLQLRLPILESLRQIKGWLLIKARSTIVKAVESRLVRH